MNDKDEFKWFFIMMLLFIPVWIWAIANTECGLMSNIECDVRKIRSNTNK